MTMSGWVLGPTVSVWALMQSVAQYANIKPGEDFGGYS